MRVEVTNRRQVAARFVHHTGRGDQSLVHRILCASNNRKKVRELTSILQRLPDVIVQTPTDLDLELEVEETGSTFAENAVLKAEAFTRATGMLSVSDDSGLVVDALGGAPGIYSARYGGPGRTDKDRNELVLKELRQVPDELRSARFVCAIAVARPELETAVFEGTVEGFITRETVGEAGFGYDPIFYYPPFQRTFGEVEADLKATVSHRGKALKQADPYLQAVLADDILEEW
jgi:XTP/dITP diphosphohydrolase